MVKMTGKSIALLAILVLVTIPASASDVTYKIRSTVYDSTDPSSPVGDLYWDANSFSGFWFKIKPGLSSELLYIHNSVNSSSTMELGREIEEGDIYYVSKPQPKKTKIGTIDDESAYVVDGVDLKKYYLMGFFGSEYVSMPADPANLSAGCKPDKIAKVLMESDDENKRQMFSGDEWELADGWSLVVQQVDADGSKVWLQLNKDGVEIDSSIMSVGTNLTNPQRTYLYKDADDYPVFYCYIDSIFRGTNDDFVVLSYSFLRGDLTTLEEGDTYGLFDVEGFGVPAVMNGTNYAGSASSTVLNTGDDALVMSSNDDISLDPDATIDLYGGIYLKTEDTTSPCLKMTLWKTCTITVPDTVAGEETENNEIVIVNMAEDADKGDSAASTKDEAEASLSIGDEGDAAVISSVAAPGLGILLAFAGLVYASRIMKQ